MAARLRSRITDIMSLLILICLKVLLVSARLTSKIARHTVIAIAFALWALLLPVLSMADRAAPETAGSVLRVGFYDLKPLVFKDVQGMPQGLFVKVLGHIAEEEHWTLSWVHGSWTESLARLNSGEIDLLVSVSYSDERAKSFDFNKDAVATDWGLLYRHKNSHLESMTDLAGKRVSVMRTGIYTNHFKKLAEQFDVRMEFVERENYSQIIADVEAGRSYAGIGSNLVGMSLEGSVDVVRSGIVFSPVKVMYAVRKGAYPEIIQAIDRRLEELKADRRSLYYNELEHMVGKPKEVIPKEAYWAVSGVVTALLLAVVFILLLRRQVSSKTKELSQTNKNLHEQIDKHEISKKKLEESEERYRLITESVAAIPWQFDITENRWTYVGPQVQRLLGYAPEEWTTLEWWLERIHPDDKTWVPDYCASLTAKGENHAMEYRILAKDGTAVWVNDLVTVEMRDGQPVMMRGIMLDITERKMAEEARIKLEGQLKQAQKIESVGRLAGGVAHDFNNMLGVILGHAHLALMETDPAQPLQAHLEEISKAAKRSADLTRQLLTFARQQAVLPKVLDLNETVAGMLQMLQRLIGENIVLLWHPADKLWSVKMDPSQFDQILANLCVNARDAISGTGKITIKTTNISIDSGYCITHPEATPGDYVQLTVSDNGKGMDKSLQAHIFEPFYTTKGMGQGTGLGLATVDGAVRQNKGFITLYSEPGLGTIFNIYLPRTEVSAPTLPEPTKKPLRRGNETILLVEDDEMLLSMKTEMLEESGYTVLPAALPSIALSLAEHHPGPIQLLISDVIMPEMNGKALSEQILKLRPALKVIFMSGYTADIISSQGFIEEGVSFLQKPISFETLTAKVVEVLDS